MMFRLTHDVDSGVTLLVELLRLDSLEIGMRYQLVVENCLHIFQVQGRMHWVGLV